MRCAVPLIDRVHAVIAAVVGGDVLSVGSAVCLERHVHLSQLLYGLVRGNVHRKALKQTEAVQLSTDGVQLSTAGVQLSTDGVQLSTDGVQLSTDGVQLSTDGVQLSTDRVQRSTDGVQLSTDGVQLSTDGVQLSTDGVQLSTDGVQLSTDGVQLSTVQSDVDGEVCVSGLVSMVQGLVSSSTYSFTPDYPALSTSAFISQKVQDSLV